MRRYDSKIILIYILIVMNLLFVNFVGYKYITNITNCVINPVFWIIIFLISYSIFKESKQRISCKINKEQSILIIILIYLMLYFVQGLFFGYAKSPYSRSFTGLCLNVWSYILIIFYQEVSRNILVRNGKKIFTLILFILIDINLYSFFQINDIVTLFKQISSVLLPSIASNLLLIYLTGSSGLFACLLYKMPISLANYLLPIFPDIDWYFISVETTLLPFIIYLVIKNINEKRINRNIRKTKIRKKNFTTIILMSLLLMFVCFTAGLFKYKPISIISNSMVPIFKRGDIVVTEKLSLEEKKKLEKYDIIEYTLDNIIVVHRIIAIEKHGDDVLYITKGDNNNRSDKEKVKPEQIHGVAKFKIPYLGYPSVWLRDFLNSEQNLVETGK